MTRDFILDTLLPYKQNSDNCSFEKGLCLYLSANGNRCAVGKHMKDGSHQKSKASIECLLRENREDDILTDAAISQHISINIWMTMQRYHDGIALKYDVSHLNNVVRELELKTGFEFSELKFN